MTARRRVAAALVALVALVVAGACGGGGGGEGGGDGGGGGALSAEDETARAVNMRLNDLPSGAGWERLPAGIDQEGDEADRRFADCMDRPPPETLRVAVADSDDFSTRTGINRASSTVQVMRTEDIARDDFAALATDRAVECLKARLDDQLERDEGPVPAAGTTLERIDFPPFGDDTAAFRYRADAGQGGQTVSLVVDLVFVRKGRLEISAGFVSSGQAVPATVQREAVEKMVARAGP
jgi:hypothetical protein